MHLTCRNFSAVRSCGTNNAHLMLALMPCVQLPPSSENLPVHSTSDGTTLTRYVYWVVRKKAQTSLCHIDATVQHRIKRISKKKFVD